jgi:hypothetical protein
MIDRLSEMYDAKNDVEFDCECDCVNSSIFSVNVENNEDKKILEVCAVD